MLTSRRSAAALSDAIRDARVTVPWFLSCLFVVAFLWKRIPSGGNGRSSTAYFRGVGIARARESDQAVQRKHRMQIRHKFASCPFHYES